MIVNYFSPYVNKTSQWLIKYVSRFKNYLFSISRHLSPWWYMYIKLSILFVCIDKSKSQTFSLLIWNCFINVLLETKVFYLWTNDFSDRFLSREKLSKLNGRGSCVVQWDVCKLKCSQNLHIFGFSTPNPENLRFHL